MECVKSSDLRLYLNNKSIKDAIKLELVISKENYPNIDVVLTRVVKEDGLFGVGVKEVLVPCRLVNWRDEVVRLEEIEVKSESKEEAQPLGDEHVGASLQGSDDVEVDLLQEEEESEQDS